MKIDELKQTRDEIIRIANEHGARKLRIFGSLARGESGMRFIYDDLLKDQKVYNMHRATADRDMKREENKTAWTEVSG